MKRLALLALPPAIVASGLSGCGLIWDSSRLDDALEVLPGGVTRVTFFDRAHAVDRLDLEEIDEDSTEEELDAYVEQAQEMPWGTAIEASLVPMLESAPFSALDIEWEVAGYDGEDVGRVWKMDDDLDLDDVADELVDAGFAEEDAGDDVRSLTIDVDELGADRSYLAVLQEVTLVPDEHLVVTGPLTGDVLDAIADEADSAVDTEAFEELADSTDEVEVAHLARDDAACTLGGSAASSEQLEASVLAELGRPEQTGFFVHGDDGEARSVLRFADEQAAEEDAEARAAFLDGSSPISGVPYSELGTWDVETDSDQVRIDVEYDDPRDIPAIIGRGDLPSVCTTPS